LNILHDHLQGGDVKQEMLNAFKAYDHKKTGFINVKDLRAILTGTGEKLSNRDGNFNNFSFFLFKNEFCLQLI